MTWLTGLRSGCGASGGDEVFSRVHVLRFVLKERDCSLHRPGRAGPLLTKRTRLCPRRRAAEHQQLSDGGRKDVATAGARLRGATRGAGADGMNTTKTTWTSRKPAAWFYAVDSIWLCRLIFVA